MNNLTNKKTTSTYHHGNLKATLVASARELIETGGSSHLTMRRVAEAAGVSSAAAYRHFSDREALLAEVLCAVFLELAEAMRKARCESTHPVSGFFATGHAYLDYARSNPQLYQVLFSEECKKIMHPTLLEAGQTAFNEVHQAAKDCAEAGYLASRGQPIDIAMAGWVNVHGLASLYLDGMFNLVVPMDWEAAVESLFTTLMNGVSPSATDFISQQIRKQGKRWLPKMDKKQPD